MKIFVIVATKGRPRETGVLLDYLGAQSRRPDGVIIVGSESGDVTGLAEHPLANLLSLDVEISHLAGAAIQRNFGLDLLMARHGLKDDREWIVVFFDDDFRPDQSWLFHCAAHFSANAGLVGLTGLVLADGVNCNGFSEDQAQKFLSGQFTALPHWSGRGGDRSIDCLYGCNMAFRGRVAATTRFDERLPLYSWQEDRDYSSQVARRGELAVATACRGVHMGIQNGRTSGLRFGYSQVANIAYLVTKNSISVPGALRFAGRNVVANFARTLMFDRRRDYAGRLRGNAMALADLLRGRVEPERILKL